MTALARSCLLTLSLAAVGCGREGRTGAIAWGVPKDGLQAGLEYRGVERKPHIVMWFMCHVRNAGVKPIRIVDLPADGYLLGNPPLDLRVGGEPFRRYGCGELGTSTPRAEDYVDLAPGASSSVKVYILPEGWGDQGGALLKAPFEATVTFTFSNGLASRACLPRDPQTGSYPKVGGLWTGKIRSDPIGASVGRNWRRIIATVMLVAASLTLLMCVAGILWLVLRRRSALTGRS